jgi:shikimate kinase/3-dehydroquinate synthase
VQAHGGVAEATAAPARRALVFVGFMGSGKTSAARTLAAELDTLPLDLDHEFEREAGETIEAFWDREGEPAFRMREEALALDLLRRPDARVVALGGGTLGSDRVREALRDHVAVHLEVEPEDAWHRAATGNRPLARDRRRFDQLHADRRPTYDAVAAATLPPGSRELPRRALPALLALREAPAGARLEWALCGEAGGYPVFAGAGLLRAGFFHPDGDAPRFLLHDPAAGAGELLEAQARLAVDGGERAKTLRGLEDVVRAMAAGGLGRDGLLVAAGGGVVGDLGGFAAAVYQRGIPWVGVPTTLLSQVDSAYGGKTGVDLPEGKNYVGAFHQPTAVLVDPEALDGLPDAEWAAGYAEVVKTALIAGGPLWARVRAGGRPDLDVILGCARTKLRVVAEDEHDEGRRQVLNLGHTVAHALEAATGYAHLRHGEAVALGLLCALRLSGRASLRDEVAELLRSGGLPLRPVPVRVDEVLALLQRDKKRRAGSVPWVLLETPGAATYGHALAPDEVRAAVAEVCAP